MKLIAITGLAGIEKGRLTLDMATHLQRQGQRVLVLDNGENNPLNTLQDHALSPITIERITGDLSVALYSHLAEISKQDMDIVLLNVAESLNPEELYASLTGIAEINIEDVRVIAVLDDRTCNCFPHVQDLLEQFADLTLTYPFTLEEALSVL
ncbi:MAG: hypothetical protein RLP44_12640 [Aggregatilineales bacterium]